MPVIQVRALPMEPPLDTAAVLRRISADFARHAGIDESFVSLSWTWLQPGHYVCGGVAAEVQPQATHPLLVDLLVPEFHDTASAVRLLRVLAATLSEHTGVSLRNIFIELRLARSGRVFDDGVVVGW